MTRPPPAPSIHHRDRPDREPDPSPDPAPVRRPVRPDRSPVPRGGPQPVLAAVALALLLAAAPASAAQPGECAEPGMNGECSEFGAIVMANQVDIRGEPAQVPVTIVLSTAYQDQAARWLLFSARSVEPDGSPAPVSIGLAGFASDDGDIATTRIEQLAPGELEIWVDTLDVPLGVPISLDLVVGASERGAYKMEALVMAFDRGYVPVRGSDGLDASLYSFTTLGVNGPTEAAPGSGGASQSFGDRVVPAPGALAAAFAVGLAAVASACLRRRR